MSKYKTMDEWYQDWLEGNTLIKRTRISSKVYKERVMKKLENPNIKQALEKRRAQYNLYPVKYETIEGWDEERKKAYWQRELLLITNKYDKLRFEQWKKNYLDRMKELGIDDEIIEEFKDEVTYRNRDLIDLLPSLHVLYVSSTASMQETDDYAYEIGTEIQNVWKNIRENRLINYKEYQKEYQKRYRSTHKRFKRK